MEARASLPVHRVNLRDAISMTGTGGDARLSILMLVHINRGHAQRG